MSGKFAWPGFWWLAGWLWTGLAVLLALGAMSDRMYLAVLLLLTSAGLSAPPLRPALARARIGRKAAIGGAWLTALFGMAAIGANSGPSKVAQKSKTAAAPAPLAKPAIPMTKERADYLEKLRRESASLEKPKTFDPAAWRSKDAMMIQIALLGVQAAVYDEGSTIHLDESEEAERQRYKTLLIRQQQERLPILRTLFADSIADAMKDHGFRVVTSGDRKDVMAISGPLVGQEAVADIFMKNVGAAPAMFRFTSLTFGSPDGTTVERRTGSIDDDVVAILKGEGWVPVQ